MKKQGSWYKAWQDGEDGPLLVMELTEAEAAKEVDVSLRGPLADWLIIKMTDKGPRYSHRIFYAEDYRAKLEGEGHPAMSQEAFDRWHSGRQLVEPR